MSARESGQALIAPCDSRSAPSELKCAARALCFLALASSTTVSLVLGSGGARGLAHIGVIQWLTENGYDIRSIAGSSMGALVGGTYAAGKLAIFAEWVLAFERMHVVRLLDPAFGRTGLFKGERVMRLLRELIGDFEIEELPLAFTAVATDIASGEEVWLRHGKLFDAIRASIATPLVFTPFDDGKRKLVDGGLVDPVPIAPTLNDETDLTVAVDLSGAGELRPAAPIIESIPDGSAYRQKVDAFVDSVQRSQPSSVPMRGMIDIALASMEAMQTTIARLRLAAYSPDVLVEIPRNACGFHEFWRAEELIALGRERTALAFRNERALIAT